MSVPPYSPPLGDAFSVQLIYGYAPPAGAAIAVVLDPAAVTAPAAKQAYKSVQVVFGRGSGRNATPLDSPWRPTSRRDVGQAVDWDQPPPVDYQQASGWASVARADRRATVAWAFSHALHALLQSAWAHTLPTDHQVIAAWRAAAQHLQLAETLPWVKVYPHDVANASAWARALLPARIYQESASSAYTPPLGDQISAALTGGYVPPPQLAIVVVMQGVVQARAVVVMRADPWPAVSAWGRVGSSDRRCQIRWGHGPQYHRPDPPPIDSGWTGIPNEPPPIPIARRVYIVMNDVSVVRLPERTPIEVLSVDLNASVDAWAWTVRMELANPSQLTLLKPDGNGPKLVEITMNTYVWTAIVEGRDRSREWLNKSVTVTGRSQTALLAEDYTARRSLAVADGRSAQQLANLEITDRALPFTVDWRGLDWVVPGGVWYYQDMAPIDVISQIAAARGAVVQSHPSDPTLIVQSRYPVSPWAWSAGAADVALPVDWMTNITAQQRARPLYDAVIVAGQQQGVLVKVTRAASAGETFASQVVDQLIVTADVGLERGRNVLSDRGMQEQIEADIPLFAPGTITAGMSGLYAPQMLVDVQDPDDPWQGQTVGVTISARRAGPDNKALEIWQRVSLERHLTDAS